MKHYGCLFQQKQQYVTKVFYHFIIQCGFFLLHFNVFGCWHYPYCSMHYLHIVG